MSNYFVTNLGLTGGFLFYKYLRWELNLDNKINTSNASNNNAAIIPK